MESDGSPDHEEIPPGQPHDEDYDGTQEPHLREEFHEGYFRKFPMGGAPPHQFSYQYHVSYTQSKLFHLFLKNFCCYSHTINSQ